MHLQVTDFSWETILPVLKGSGFQSVALNGQHQHCLETYECDPEPLNQTLWGVQSSICVLVSPPGESNICSYFRTPALTHVIWTT